MTIFCVTAVRNEARYLPGFLAHLRDNVDGIVALDDCSTDDTARILDADPRVRSILRQYRAGPAHATETENRYRLFTEAARLGAQWVICADADERFETGFLTRLREEADLGESSGQILRCVRIVNLWNSVSQYRVDGACAPRYTVRMFKLPAAFTQRAQKMHQPWFPPELDGAPHGYMNAYLYHLRMIERADREMRFAKFSAVDPNREHQLAGYDHLVEESGLTLKYVVPGREFMQDELTRAIAARTTPGPTRFPTQETFDEHFYLNQHVDVLKAVLDGHIPTGWDQFIGDGCDEGRLWRRRLQLTGFDFQRVVTTWRQTEMRSGTRRAML